MFHNFLFKCHANLLPIQRAYLRKRKAYIWRKCQHIKGFPMSFPLVGHLKRCSVYGKPTCRHFLQYCYCACVHSFIHSFIPATCRAIFYVPRWCLQHCIQSSWCSTHKEGVTNKLGKKIRTWLGKVTCWKSHRGWVGELGFKASLSRSKFGLSGM